MGTNYYLSFEECKCCGVTREPVHIGKNSMGWTFMFEVWEGKAESWAQWRIILQKPESKIVDEYNREVNYLDFVTVVETNQKAGNRNHAKVFCHHDDGTYVDHEGYAMIRREFS